MELLALLGDFTLSREEEDDLIWVGDSSGCFSVKLAVDRVSHEEIGTSLPCLA